MVSYHLSLIVVVDGLHYPPVVLRPGGVSVEEIRACGGVWEKVIVATHEDDDCEGTPRAPGMKYKHYSPRAGVILYEVGANPPSGAHIMGSRKRVGILRTRTWKAGFAEEAVRNIRQTDSSHPPVEIFERDLGYHGKDIGRRLFRALRELDEKEVDVIHVEGIEEVDEGLAVMNRLGKAASVVVRKVARDERDER
jgi:L-threonylcarbamoyladenylate synthase